jgi:TRAP-type mannitol/chloroaromatic compound transport system permease large subunit
VTLTRIDRGVWPFVGLQLVCLALCILVPGIVLALSRAAGML